MDDPQEIAKEIATSEARRIESRVEFLYATYSIFNRNFQELQQLLERFRDAEPDEPIWDVDRRYELGLVMQEAMRLLHNFLASAMTLVDVTRKLIRSKYAGEPFLQEYQFEVDKSFIENSTARFVQELRNYMLHYSIPITFAQLNISLDDDAGALQFESRIVLDRVALMEWGGWTGPAKAYLVGQNSDIDILSFSTEYHTQVRAFHGWLQRRIRDLHSSDFVWLREMRQKLEITKGEGKSKAD